MLCPAGTEIEDIDGTDAPGMVIAVLPVKQTILPIASTLVPPLAGGIAVLIGIAVQDGRIACGACIEIDAEGASE